MISLIHEIKNWEHFLNFDFLLNFALEILYIYMYYLFLKNTTLVVKRSSEPQQNVDSAVQNTERIPKRLRHTSPREQLAPEAH